MESEDAIVKPANRAQIDNYAALAIEHNMIERQMKKLRPSIEALGEGTHKGFEDTLVLTKVTTKTLSIPIVKSLMTPAQIIEATVESSSIRITVDH